MPHREFRAQQRIHRARSGLAGQGQRGRALLARGLILAVQTQQQGPLVAGGGIPWKVGHHLVAAPDGLGDLLHVHIPQTVIDLHPTLRQIRFATRLQQQGAGQQHQDAAGSSGRPPII